MSKKRAKANKKQNATKQRTERREIKNDIAKAVERIPAMLAQEQRFEAPVAEKQPREPRKFLSPNSDRQTRLLLWTGVSIITATVFVMWIWNAKAMFYDLAHTKSAEAALIDGAKDDISAVFKKPVPTTPVQKAPPTTDTVKQALYTLLATNVSSTTPATNNDETIQPHSAVKNQ